MQLTGLPREPPALRRDAPAPRSAGRLGRAILGALVVVLASGTASAGPDVSVDARSGVYQDTDHTFISTSLIALRATLKDLFTIRGKYLADVVSAASVDVVSAATSHFDDLRHEVEGGVTYADGARTASLGYVFSGENDWISHSVRASFAHDLLEHRLTLGAGAALTFNDVGRRGDPSFHRDLTQGTASVDATAVASRDDLVSLGYSLIVLSGYQASPYRFVFFRSPAVPQQLAGNPETVPDERLRHALGLRWNHHVDTDSSIRSHIRGYADDWGVLSATAGVEYVLGLGSFELGPVVRGYVQDRAELYAPQYDERRRYMSRDRELSTFVDVFGGLRAAYRGSPARSFTEFRAEVKVEGFHFHYFDFPLLPDRSGIIAELGVGASF